MENLPPVPRSPSQPRSAPCQIRSKSYLLQTPTQPAEPQPAVAARRRSVPACRISDLPGPLPATPNARRHSEAALPHPIEQCRRRRLVREADGGVGEGDSRFSLVGKQLLHDEVATHQPLSKSAQERKVQPSIEQVTPRPEPQLAVTARRRSVPACRISNLSAPLPTAPNARRHSEAALPHSIERRLMRETDGGVGVGDSRFSLVGKQFLNDEVAAQLASSQPAQEQETQPSIEQMFRAWDANGDGVITRDEVRRLMRFAVGSSFEADCVDALLFMGYGIGGDGKIVLEDFRRLLQRLAPRKANSNLEPAVTSTGDSALLQTAIWNWFDALKPRSSSYITFNDFLDAHLLLDKDADIIQIRQDFTNLDHDCDNKISWKEFFGEHCRLLDAIPRPTDEKAAFINKRIQALNLARSHA